MKYRYFYQSEISPNPYDFVAALEMIYRKCYDNNNVFQKDELYLRDSGTWVYISHEIPKDAPEIQEADLMLLLL